MTSSYRFGKKMSLYSVPAKDTEKMCEQCAYPIRRYGNKWYNVGKEGEHVCDPPLPVPTRAGIALRVYG